MRQPAQHRIGLAAAKPDGAFESRHLLVEGQSRGALGAVARVKVFTSPAGYPSGSREDPVIWCSGGQYHLVYNYYDLRKARHMVSPDGIKNWRAPHFHRVGIRIRLRSGLADSLAETTIVSCPEIVGGGARAVMRGGLIAV